MKFILKSVKEKKFKTDDGEMMPYYWYKAERVDKGTMCRIGSTEGGHPIGTELEMDVEECEGQFKPYFKEWV